jgi:hypothetical protein
LPRFSGLQRAQLANESCSGSSGAFRRAGAQFLFDQPVTDFLWRMWLDAVAANHDRRIIDHQIEGDRNAAMERAHELNVKYLMGDPDRPHILVEAFAPMKINQKRSAASWRTISSGAGCAHKFPTPPQEKL